MYHILSNYPQLTFLMFLFCLISNLDMQSHGWVCGRSQSELIAARTIQNKRTKMIRDIDLDQLHWDAIPLNLPADWRLVEWIHAMPLPNFHFPPTTFVVLSAFQIFISIIECRTVKVLYFSVIIEPFGLIPNVLICSGLCIFIFHVSALLGCHLLFLGPIDIFFPAFTCLYSV